MYEFDSCPISNTEVYIYHIGLYHIWKHCVHCSLSVSRSLSAALDSRSFGLVESWELELGFELVKTNWSYIWNCSKTINVELEL